MDSHTFLNGIETLSPIPALAISGLAADSRKVKPGFAFFAISGAKADGMSFAAEAAEAGAALIITEAEDAPAKFGAATVVKVRNARRALALAAANFYPRQPAVIVAVTGTSGKTSVAAFVRQIFLAAGHAAASIGTVGVVKPSGETYGGLTTPDPVSLHETLQQLADEGVTHCALEASSHGLDQFRLDGVRLKAAGFTNLSRDHMDYHPTVEHYRAAKLRLMRDVLPQDGASVIVDSEAGEAFIAASEARGLNTLVVSRPLHMVEKLRLANSGDIVVFDISHDGAGQVISLAYRGEDYRVRLPLIGAFQAENALLAAGLAIGCGIAPTLAFAALERLEGAPGRLDFVGEHNGGAIILDYAHKPGALSAVLDAVRPFATGRLIVVVGCGGDRDAGKRPLMGRIAVEKADIAIITDDNPRTEDPAAIRAAILADAPGAIEVGDRAEAIRHGVSLLQKGDILVIAGKGHESGQIIGSTTVPFSDRDEAARAMRELRS